MVSVSGLNPVVNGINGGGLLDIIQEFQTEVDKTLPGMYVWFSKASLHVTVRALL